MSSTVGSPTNTGWKRRSSAGSFSMCLRYSSSVVAPTARSSPRASIGLSMLPASIAPSAAPAPTIVCSSSMNTMIWPSASAISLSTAFSRSSNSPRYLEPATIAPRSSAISRRSRRPSGTSPATIRCARPSTIAVLPTPGSPISTGLFLVRRRQHLDHAADLVVAADHRVELALRARPRSGRGRSCSSAWNLSSGFWSVTRCEPRTSSSALSSSSWAAPLARSASPALPGCVAKREQQVLGRDVFVPQLAHLVLGGAQDLDELARAARGLAPPAAAQLRQRVERRPSAWRTAAGSTPSLRSTGATTPPSCSSSTASRCSGVVCGLRRSSASRCAACERLLGFDRKSVWLHVKTFDLGILD